MILHGLRDNKALYTRAIFLDKFPDKFYSNVRTVLTIFLSIFPGRRKQNHVMTRKTRQLFSVHTSNKRLSREICQEKNCSSERCVNITRFYS